MPKWVRVPNGPVVLRLVVIVNCPTKSGTNLGVGRGLCPDTTDVDAARMAATEAKSEEQRILLSELALVRDVPVEVNVWSLSLVDEP